MTKKTSVRYNATFQKKGNMVYISHLDLMALFRRSIRRADLPFVLTEGFTPRVKISAPKALKVGQESDSEEMVFWLREEKESDELAQALNEQMPEGVRILQIKKG
ncbi:MAG: TIGR03936 family radical SAM-associated protein [Candidatus Omnitrophota bacterium]